MATASPMWTRIFPPEKIGQVVLAGSLSNMNYKSCLSDWGAVDYWVATVKPGTILFEISAVPEEVARAAFNLASYKLPVKTKFIIRND